VISKQYTNIGRFLTSKPIHIDRFWGFRHNFLCKNNQSSPGWFTKKFVFSRVLKEKRRSSYQKRPFQKINDKSSVSGFKLMNVWSVVRIHIPLLFTKPQHCCVQYHVYHKSRSHCPFPWHPGLVGIQPHFLPIQFDNAAGIPSTCSGHGPTSVLNPRWEKYLSTRLALEVFLCLLPEVTSVQRRSEHHHSRQQHHKPF